MKKIMIKKLSWAVLTAILFCCMFNSQLSAQETCPTAVVSCADAGNLVLQFNTPADAAAFVAANPTLTINIFNGFVGGTASGNQAIYNEVFPFGDDCGAVTLDALMERTGCISSPPVPLASAGNMVATGTTFNSNGTTGEEGTTVDTNTPGTYTFYAEADCEGCLSESRTPFTLTIESAELQCMAQDITITLDGTGNATIAADDIDNGSMLGCAGGTLNLSLDQTTFTCDNVLTTNTVTLTVDDGNGNSSTCTATVTVLPDATCTDPSLDCPATQVSCTGDPFNLNPAEPGGTYGGTAAPFVMNDVLNPTGMPPGSYTLTYTVNGFMSELCEFIVVRPVKSANAGSLRN